MGCCSARPVEPAAPDGGYGQSSALRSVLAAGVASASESPPPSLDLSSPEVKSATVVDGVLFGELVRAGFVLLASQHHHLNKINVFPIPDGDTGNNMVITLMPSVVALGAQPPADLAASAQKVADQAALASQGNSGTIFSFMFGSLSKAFQERAGAMIDTEAGHAGPGSGGGPGLPVADFVACLREVGAVMSRCMADPVPGTMVSVAKEALSHAGLDKAADLESVVAVLREAGNAACKRTPQELKVNGRLVLKGKGVVDSGAQGFVYLLDGMDLALKGKLEYGNYLSQFVGVESSEAALEENCCGEETKEEAIQEIHSSFLQGGSAEDTKLLNKFPFCTECVAELRPGVGKDEIIRAINAATTGAGAGPGAKAKAAAAAKRSKRQVTPAPTAAAAAAAAGGGAGGAPPDYPAQLGDNAGTSLAMNVTTLANDVTLAKVHIHTADPPAVFAGLGACAKDGYLYKQKCDDMRQQVRMAGRPRQVPTLDGPACKTGIVFDSFFDLPVECMDRWRDRMVPLMAVVDATSYRDRVDLKGRALCDIIRRKDFTTTGTSGANKTDLRAALTKALDNPGWQDVLLMLLPRTMSLATFNNMTAVLGELAPAQRSRVKVWHSRFACGGPALMRAHWMASRGKTAAEITAELDAWHERPGVCSGGIFHTITFMRNIGRFDQIEKRLFGIVRIVLNKAERRKKAMGAFYKTRKLDPVKPDQAKAKVAGFKPYDAILHKVVRLFDSEARAAAAAGAAKAGAQLQQFDLVVTHFYEPWIVDKVLAAFQSRSIKIRNVYVAEVSNVSICGAGIHNIIIHMWPADECEFPIAPAAE